MSFLLDSLDSTICLAVPKRLTPVSAWHEHIPFAMFLVEALKPRLIVELGTHYGDSYCAFCQAVKELDLRTACYAVDSWQGDPHGGFYGSEVLADLRAHHDPLYGKFSQLIRSTFDEALEYFANGTIDLLHIDGYHTYEAVKHDFELWFPKISARGVVLLHDTDVREGDFGVWKFWDEVRHRYPHFEFLHGSGLGVLAVGVPDTQELHGLFRANAEQAARVRNVFFSLGHELSIISMLQTRVASLTREVESRTHEVESLAHEVESLTHEVESLTHECEMILNSRSWRLMAPARWSSLKLRSLRQFFSRKPESH